MKNVTTSANQVETTPVVKTTKAAKTATTAAPAVKKTKATTAKVKTDDKSEKVATPAPKATTAKTTTAAPKAKTTTAKPAGKVVSVETAKEVVKNTPVAVKHVKRVFLNFLDDAKLKNKHFKAILDCFTKPTVHVGKSGISIKSEPKESQGVKNLLTLNDTYMDGKEVKTTLNLNGLDPKKVKLPKGMEKKIHRGYVRLINLTIPQVTEIVKLNF